MAYLTVVFTIGGGVIGIVYGVNTTVTDIVGYEAAHLLNILSQGEIEELGFIASTLIGYLVDAQFDFMYTGIISFIVLGFLKIPFIEFMVFNIYKIIFGFNPKINSVRNATLV